MRKFLFIFFTIILCQSTYAQKGFKLGFFGLPQNTWMLNGDDFQKPQDQFKYELTWGMAGGGLIGYNFHDMIGLKLNVMYSHQGQRYSSLNSVNDPVMHKVKLHYLKLPLMLSFNTKTEYAKVIFALNLGFQANLLIGAKYTDNNQLFVPDPSMAENIFDFPTFSRRFNRLDYGPMMDIGVDVKLTYNMMANIRLRADYGLTDAENKDITYNQVENGLVHKYYYYDQSRLVTNNLTGGILFGLTYTFTSQ